MDLVVRAPSGLLMRHQDLQTFYTLHFACSIQIAATLKQSR